MTLVMRLCDTVAWATQYALRTACSVSLASSHVAVIERVEAEVTPDYFQFYARRTGATSRYDEMTPQGYAAKLWSDDGFVFVGCDKLYGPTPIVVEVLDAPPSPRAPAWQHVAEVSLSSGGREFMVESWDDDRPVATVELGPDAFRLRVSWAGLGLGDDDGFDKHGVRHERLLLQLWPTEFAAAEVVRWWPQWRSTPSARGSR